MLVLGFGRARVREMIGAEFQVVEWGGRGVGGKGPGPMTPYRHGRARRRGGRGYVLLGVEGGGAPRDSLAESVRLGCGRPRACAGLAVIVVIDCGWPWLLRLWRPSLVACSDFRDCGHSSRRIRVESGGGGQGVILPYAAWKRQREASLTRKGPGVRVGRGVRRGTGEREPETGRESQREREIAKECES